jgi:5-amino-6-(5-phosphoribosylamino)uracil reductase
MGHPVARREAGETTVAAALRRRRAPRYVLARGRFGVRAAGVLVPEAREAECAAGLRPYVLLSVATSVDGCTDDSTPARLILSNDADLDRVDEVRAGSDAIMVGAATVRRDNPRLLVRSPGRRQARVARGLPASPARVTLTRSGALDPAARFFTAGEGVPLVYAPAPAVPGIRQRLAGSAAEVIGAGDPLSLDAVLADLAARGVRRLMVEGGGTLHAQFLAAGLADELHLAIAPVFVGDPGAPRLAAEAGPAGSHGGAGGVPRRMQLAEIRQIGDMVLLRYLAGSRPGNGSGHCPPAGLS